MVEAFSGVTHIQWLKDKDTGKFYGSCFLEMATAEDAERAVTLNDTELFGRWVKVKYAPLSGPAAGRWPPYGSEVGKMGGAGPDSEKIGPPPFPKCRKFFVRDIAETATE